LGLAVELGHEAGVGGQLRHQDLEGHAAVQFGVVGLIDDAEAAAAEFFEDFVLAELLGWLVSHLITLCLWQIYNCCAA